jgi:hypothetical protein
MRKRRARTALVLLLTFIMLGQTSSAAVTDWSTKASVDSRGLSSFWNTEAGAFVDVRNPYAIRVRFKTPTDVSRKVSYVYEIVCEKASYRQKEGTTTTPTDGTWKNVTIQPASTALGRACAVAVAATITDGARLQMRIEAKHP